MLKEKNGQSRMLNTMNLSFQNESEIKLFFRQKRKGGREEKEMKQKKERREEDGKARKKFHQYHLKKTK